MKIEYDASALAYIEMCESRDIASLNMKACGIMSMWHDKSNILSEENQEDFHKFVSKKEPVELEHVASRIVNPDNMWDHPVHSWLTNSDVMHNQELGDKHKENFDHTDYSNIDQLVHGGLTYGDSGTRKLNEHLVEQHKLGNPLPTTFKIPDEEREGEHLDLDSIDSTLKKNRLDKSLKTYHGTNFDPKDHFSKNNIVHLPTYNSSSLQPLVGARYGVFGAIHNGSHIAHVIEIHHPKGSTGAYIGNDEHLTAFKDNEFITPRGMTLQFNKEPTKYQMDNGNEIHFWKAKRMIGLEK